jgi:hypothetical protein
VTGIPLNNRPVDLEQLKTELATAGVAVTALGTIGDTLVTYDASGAPADLPPAANAVVAAHTPSTALRDQLVSALTSSVGVGLTTLTQAQRLALVAGLLYKAGAIDRQGVVRPLAQWLVS